MIYTVEINLNQFDMFWFVWLCLTIELLAMTNNEEQKLRSQNLMKKLNGDKKKSDKKSDREGLSWGVNRPFRSILAQVLQMKRYMQSPMDQIWPKNDDF